jgi:hypothetical protein
VVSRASYICGGGDENRYTEVGRGYEETIACSTTQLGARRDIAANSGWNRQLNSWELFPLRGSREDRKYGVKNGCSIA